MCNDDNKYYGNLVNRHNKHQLRYQQGCVQDRAFKTGVCVVFGEMCFIFCARWNKRQVNLNSKCYNSTNTHAHPRRYICIEKRHVYVYTEMQYKWSQSWSTQIHLANNHLRDHRETLTHTHTHAHTYTVIQIIKHSSHCQRHYPMMVIQSHQHVWVCVSVAVFK